MASKAYSGDRFCPTCYEDALFYIECMEVAQRLFRNEQFGALIMNDHSVRVAATPQYSAGFKDNYYTSTNELRRGTTINEVCLGHLANEELVELLRMRGLWKRH